jgi:hypothetical protein
MLCVLLVQGVAALVAAAVALVKVLLLLLPKCGFMKIQMCV